MGWQDRGASAYRRWRLWIEPERLRMIKVVREWLEPTPRDALVVEVGAGVGFMKKELRKANPTARYIGGDVAATNTTQVVFDAAALPWGPSALDALVAMEVVEHLETPEEFLREAARVLRPQGHLIVTMPFMFGVHDFRDYRRSRRWASSRSSRSVASPWSTPRPGAGRSSRPAG